MHSSGHLHTCNAESVEAGEEFGLVTIFVENVEAYAACKQIFIIINSSSSHSNYSSQAN